MATKKPRHRFDPVAPGPEKEGISPTNLALEPRQLALDLTGGNTATVRPSLLQGRLAAAARWSLADPRGSLERLQWDLAQAGGLSQLAAALGADRRVVTDHMILLRRRLQRPEVRRAA